MTLHEAMKLGYRIHELKATEIAATAAQVCGRKIQSLPVLRKG